ncbi:MAG: hypothetical protein B7Y37_08900 [Sphingobacteriia bacterium 28-36-52]|nr:MAG: hypothetical protein B7Y37_08900 [Sphingobacteriia bacterium 28-36-52]
MKEKILAKVNSLIAKCEELVTLAARFEQNWTSLNDRLLEAEFRAFRTSTLSFLSQTIGNEKKYYKDFEYHVIYFKVYNLTIAHRLLQNIKSDFEEGWLNNIQGIVSAEIFSDFLEMAEHLLEAKYKDPAAVIIGSVLEENLRELCKRNKIPTTTVDSKSGKDKPTKADALNVELCKAGVYNMIFQKQITASLDLRNNAAHGKYEEYDLPQVKAFLQFVMDFNVRYL